LEYLLQVDRRSLRNLAGKAPRFYEPFDVAKKAGGGLRHIDNPIGLLKEVQRKIYRKLLRDLDLPANMVGGVTGRSVRQNALCHVGHQTLVKVDLRNHFGRITNRQVFEALRRELGLSTEIASIITRLTTVHSRLPQGAPTSTMLANLVMLPAHRAISSFAERHSLSYTLFVDDLTISGSKPRDILQQIIQILQGYGFAIAAKKLHILDRHERQETTGLVVNREIAVGRAEREQLRLELLRLRDSKVMSLRQFSSIWGRIRYIGFIHASHGQALGELAEAVLPVPMEMPEIGADEQRQSCLNPARHRYRRPIAR
jgi:RNA-directed DNA polymerase